MVWQSLSHMPAVKRAPECPSPPISPPSRTRVPGCPNAPGTVSVGEPVVTNGGTRGSFVHQYRYSMLAHIRPGGPQGDRSGQQELASFGHAGAATDGAASRFSIAGWASAATTRDGKAAVCAN